MVHDFIVRVRSSGWMGWWLLAAGVYNVAWGMFVVLVPRAPFRWAGMEPPTYPEIWQCLGMVVGVYGLLYAVAAADPLRQWPIVAVGLLGKILGPIGFFIAALQGNLPWVAGLTILTNDLIWWIPFSLILRSAYRAAHRERRSFQEAFDRSDAVSSVVTTVETQAMAGSADGSGQG